MCLAEEFIELIKSLEGEMNRWTINKISQRGGSGKSIIGSFTWYYQKITCHHHNENKSKLDSQMEDQMKFHKLLNNVISKHFHFEYSTTNYHSTGKLTIVAHFRIFRKNDTQEIGEGINGTFIRMLEVAPSDFHLKLKTLNCKWFY